MSDISDRIASYVKPSATEREWQHGYRWLCVGQDSDGWWFHRTDSRRGEHGAAKKVEVGTIENVEQLNDLFRWLEADE